MSDEVWRGAYELPEAEDYEAIRAEMLDAYLNEPPHRSVSPHPSNRERLTAMFPAYLASAKEQAEEAYKWARRTYDRRYPLRVFYEGHCALNRHKTQLVDGKRIFSPCSSPACKRGPNSLAALRRDGRPEPMFPEPDPPALPTYMTLDAFVNAEARKETWDLVQRATNDSWRDVRLQVYERDRAICHVCGMYVPSSYYQCGHIIDRCVGGCDRPSNLVVMCNVCNLTAKTPTKTRDEYFAWLAADPYVRLLRRHRRELEDCYAQEISRGSEPSTV